MSWTNKYWDIVDHFFWAPHYLGLKSIPQKLWKIDGEMVCVPKEMTHSTGPLYRRLRSGEEYWQFVRRQEETFNHIFDLAFAILPGDVICDLLCQFTNTGPGHDYASFGREISERYFWSDENVTTPDGFFVAQDSILAVELKFNAKTSLDQLAKYMMLFIVEEQLSGERESLDLLYIFSSDPEATFESQTGVDSEEVNEDLAAKLIDAAKGQIARQFLGDNQESLKGVLERVNIHCISWLDFRDMLVRFSAKLGDEPGDRTLRKLLNGLATAIAEHPLSKVDDEE